MAGNAFTVADFSGLLPVRQTASGSEGREAGKMARLAVWYGVLAAKAIPKQRQWHGLTVSNAKRHAK
ncbi:hypothetical protein NPIL_156071, partial [Nephila pilipes]